MTDRGFDVLCSVFCWGWGVTFDLGAGGRSCRALIRFNCLVILSAGSVALDCRWVSFSTTDQPNRPTTRSFCVFNNVAVAAAHAMERYGLNRIAVVDFDVSGALLVFVIS